jgi:hypothetical protein
MNVRAKGTLYMTWRLINWLCSERFTTKVRLPYLASVRDQLNVRFPADVMGFLECLFTLFDPVGMPDKQSAALKDYGVPQLAVVIKQLSTVPGNGVYHFRV